MDVANFLVAKVDVYLYFRALSDTEEHHRAILRRQAVKSVALQLKTSVNDVIMTALKTVAHFLKR